jgi:hypothetical protein
MKLSSDFETLATLTENIEHPGVEIDGFSGHTKANGDLQIFLALTLETDTDSAESSSSEPNESVNSSDAPEENAGEGEAKNKDEEECSYPGCPYTSSEHGVAVHEAKVHADDEPAEDAQETDGGETSDETGDEGNLAELLPDRITTQDEVIKALSGATSVYQVERGLNTERDATINILAKIGLLDGLSTGRPPLERKKAEEIVQEHFDFLESG